MPKLCIVAAFGPGMGHAIARRFAREGYDLALIARSLASVPAIEGANRVDAARVTVHEADLTDPAAVALAFAAIREQHGPAKVLVYNGGTAWTEAPPLARPVAAFQRDLALCITGAYACVQAVHADMKAHGGGTILFTGGGLALYPQYGACVPSLVAGKAGLRGLGLALFEAMRDDDIHVAQVTIGGPIAPGTAFDPDVIAEAYWTLHAQATTEWTPEIVFNGR